MKSFRPDFIEPEIFDSEQVSAWFTKKGESIQDSYKIEGINLGFNTDEEKEVVEANRNFVANSISTSVENIAFANQVHGNKVIEVSEGGTYEGVDGFITTKQGVTLAIQVADCAAVLLADEANKIIGAVHAGWRGAEAGIVPKVIHRMISKGANVDFIKVFVSPCISQSKFEVGEEVAEKFPDEFVDRVHFEKPHIDLKGFINHQLIESGISVEHIEIDSHCTFSDSEFYSYRREKEKSGRLMGIIKLNETK